ncbi:MAG TPA: C25 family cysteine peptidase [Pyrinomonadaceae bacterium]|nr:C25 family cysteine peptidase [Pyrinomonadaceae bacterium]
MADFTAINPPTPRNGTSPAQTCGVGATITPDASAQACSFDNTLAARTFSWSHTIGAGTSRVLIVGVSSYTNPAAAYPAVLSVTYNGVPLTRLNDPVLQPARSTDLSNGVEMFILKEPLPAAGTYTVAVNLNAGVEYAVGGSVSFNGVNQTTPNRPFQSASGTSTTPSVVVTSATNEMVIDTVSTQFNGGTLLVGAGQTERWNGVSCFGGLNSVGAGSTEPGAATTTMSWAQTNSVPWAIGAVSLIPLAPTEAKLVSFEAARTGAGNRVRWLTGFEVNNLGFNLYRGEKNGARTRVTPTMIAGSALMAGQGVALTAGRSYTWLDKQGKTDSEYWLEDVDLSGQRTLHGPILPTAHDNARIVPEENGSLLIGQLNDFAGGNAHASSMQKEYAALNDEAGKNAPSALSQLKTESNSELGNTALERQQAIASQSSIKLMVNHNAWYRVGQAELAAAGLDANVDPRLLQLYTDGDEVPIMVNSRTGSRFASGDSIEFYGQGLHTPWTATRAYWLIVGTKHGKRIEKTKVRNLPQPGTNQPTSPHDDGPTGTPTTGPSPTSGSPTSTQNNPSVFNPPFFPNGTTTAEQRPAAATPAPVDTDGFVFGSHLGRREPQPNNREVEENNSPPVVTLSAEAQPATSSAAVVASNTNPPITSKAARASAAAAKTGTATAVRVAVKKPAAALKRANRRRAKRKARIKRSAARLKGRHLRNHASLSGGGTSAESFNLTIERADRTLYFAALQNGEAENFFGQVVSRDAATVKLNIHHLATAHGQSTLRIALQGTTIEEHQVNVNLNGTDVGRIAFNGREHPTAQFSVSNALLQAGENTLVLTALKGEMDFSLVDSIGLTYPHTYEADSNALEFSVEDNQELTLSGFGSANIRVLNITDPNEVEELVITSQSAGGGYRLQFEAESAGTLLAVADSAVERPAQVIRNQPSNWYRFDPGADMVVITHADFKSALAPLVALRQSQGLKVAIIDIEDVYDEFSYGAHATPAVRDLLDWTRAHWRTSPRYVLLVGDCSLDPHNYLGQGQSDLVPTRLIDTSYLETASDDSLSDFNNDGVPEMAMGRLPVRTAAEAATVIGKIVAFQQSDLRRGALLVSDQTSDFNFEAANQEVRALLPQGMNVQTINRGSNDAALVRSQIIGGINQGPLVVNYLGHGSVEVWTGAGILRTADVPSLNNKQALSLFVMMTCLNGFAQDVYTESLAEALLRAEGGGAAAVWASSGLTQPDQQAAMNQQLVRALFSDQTATVGDAIIKAKSATQNMDTRRTWMLFGDPATRIR